VARRWSRHGAWRTPATPTDWMPKQHRGPRSAEDGAHRVAAVPVEDPSPDEPAEVLVGPSNNEQPRLDAAGDMLER